jgi:hypothetical protein
MSTGLAALLIVATGLTSISRAPNPELAAHTTVSTMILRSARPSVPPAAASTALTGGATPTEGATGDAAALAGTTSDQQKAPAASGTDLPPAPRLLVVGDSTAQANGAGMQTWATATQAAEVDVVAQLGCTFLLAGQFRIRDGWVQPPAKPCLNLVDDAIRAADDLKPDAIVVFIGSVQLADWQLPGDAQYRGMGDPVLDSQYVVAATDAITRLEAVGVPVLIADVATPNWDPDFRGKGILPGSGRVTINDAERAGRLNQLNATIIGPRPQSRVISYAGKLQRADGTVDSNLRPDGLHLTPTAAADIMSAWLANDLIAAYQSVTTAVPTTRTRTTTWAPS